MDEQPKSSNFSPESNPNSSPTPFPLKSEIAEAAKQEGTSIPKNKFVSYFFMVLSCVTFVTGYLYANEHNLHPIETSMLQGFMIMLVSIVLCAKNKVSFEVVRDVKLIMVRNMIIVAQIFVLTTVQFYLPLGIVHTIICTGPIFLVVVQYVFDGKVPNSQQLIAIAITFAGITLTSNGALLTKWINADYTRSTDFKNYRTDSPLVMAFASACFAGFMVFWAYGTYITSKIKTSPYLINFLLGCKIYFLASLLYPFIGTEEGRTFSSAGTFYWGIIYSGIIFAVGETTFILAIITTENVSMTSMVSTIIVLFGYLVSVLRYHEAINGFCLAGSILIIIGVIRVIVAG